MKKTKLLAILGLITLLPSSLCAMPAEKTIGKEENVYVISDAEGHVNKIIVSGWLKNPTKKKELIDVTDLKNITNVKGDETFKEKNGKKVWAANGNDIFYQGTTNKTLPLSVNISYRLNGYKISARDLSGKSGRVTIRFDYTPNVYETVVVDGKKIRITPSFLVLSGVVLDNENFRNVKVNTGKIINDGNRSIVVGMALPGMQDNLGLSKNTFEIPSYVEISADATDFSVTTMMTVASNEAISSLNLDNVNSSNDLSLMVSKLTKKLNQGVEELYSGVSQLDQGMQQLNSGLATLSKNSPALTDGAMQVFQALFDTAEKTFRQNHIKIEKLTIENYHQVLEPLAAKLILEKDKKQVQDLIESLDNYKKFYDGIVAYTNGVDQCYEGSILLAEGTGKLNTAITTVKNGSSELSKGVANFKSDSLGILNYVDSIDRETLRKLMATVSESETVLPRLKATIDVTQKYQSFTGLNPDMNGNVRFIYRTNSI